MNASPLPSAFRPSPSARCLPPSALRLLPSGLCLAAFPRGPGFYFSIPKLLSGLAVYLLWAWCCRWVDRDARALKLPTSWWNGLQLVAGVVGMLSLWTFPWFVGWPLALVLTQGAVLAYVRVRNDAVGEEERLLTGRHLRSVGYRLLRVKPPPPPGEKKEKPVPIRFIGKSVGAREEDPDRVRRAEESRGYKAAMMLVHEAIRQRATDIHLEPTSAETSVRYRIDGILQAAPPLDRPTGDTLINIFKVLAGLDITERRKPQDGGFAATVGGEEGALGSRQVDFRVATAGSVVGEKMVLRILDRARQVTNLGQIGMRGRLLELLRGMVKLPHGMVVVCGPTGSGKSTTLCACLYEIDRLQKNIITLENPVEYHIDNATQIEVNDRAGKTFASELRSVLRQDPDVISVGEVRDKETAEIACQAAQTGHLVFTTLHANDAVMAVARLLDLGVPAYLVAGSLNAVLGQRLVRVLCPKCKQRYKPNADLLRKANLPAEKIKYFYRPPESALEGRNPCKHCGGTGYRGRTGIFELLLMNDRIRALLRDRPDLEAVRQEAVRSGMISLHEDGLRHVIDGETSVQELLRVCR
jgi:general secretion pathway protein E